jgi:hypothetical protein
MGNVARIFPYTFTFRFAPKKAGITVSRGGVTRSHRKIGAK